MMTAQWDGNIYNFALLGKHQSPRSSEHDTTSSAGRQASSQGSLTWLYLMVWSSHSEWVRVHVDTNARLFTTGAGPVRCSWLQDCSANRVPPCWRYKDQYYSRWELTCIEPLSVSLCLSLSPSLSLPLSFSLTPLVLICPYFTSLACSWSGSSQWCWQQALLHVGPPGQETQQSQLHGHQSRCLCLPNALLSWCKYDVLIS